MIFKPTCSTSNIYDAGELSVFCQSYFNKTLIGQAGNIGGKTRQEVDRDDAMRTGEFWEAGTFLCSSAQNTGEERCKLAAGKGTEPCANVDKDNGVTYVTRTNKVPDQMGQSA